MPEPLFSIGRSLSTGLLVLPAFPLCIGRHLRRAYEPVFFCAQYMTAKEKPGSKPGFYCLKRCLLRLYAVAARASRRRALCWKNSAWLMTADTFAGWNGLAIRNAGSGRSPVRKRSG
jgi:hypothetical protein